MSPFVLTFGVVFLIFAFQDIASSFRLPLQIPFADFGFQQPFRVITLAVPDENTARNFGRALLKQGLAATVNTFPNTMSMYVWNNDVVEATEHIMLIYTHQSQYPKIERFVKENHVHVEPGIVMLPIVGGSPTFLSWLDSQTQGQNSVNERPMNNPNVQQS